MTEQQLRHLAELAHDTADYCHRNNPTSARALVAAASKAERAADHELGQVVAYAIGDRAGARHP